jgi:hypothetical protein
MSTHIRVIGLFLCKLEMTLSTTRLLSMFAHETLGLRSLYTQVLLLLVA